MRVSSGFLMEGAASGSEERNACKRVGYLKMDSKSGIRLAQVDGKLCTHIILDSVKIDSEGNVALLREEDSSYFLEVEKFKTLNPGVKILVSVVNEMEHCGFRKAALSVDVRQRFARSTIDYLQRYHLDGVDLQWEFSNFPSLTLINRDHERAGLTKILKTLRSSFVENYFSRQVNEQHHRQPTYTTNNLTNSNSNIEPSLITLAIGSQETLLRTNYELKQVASLCDWLNVLSFDYFLFKAYSPFTGPIAPLYPIVEPYVPILGRLSLSWTISRLIEEGIERDKIVVGIATYARAYRLFFKHTCPSSLTLSVGTKGGQNENYLSYGEICDILKREDTILAIDERARVPYLLTDDGYTWITFENPKSVREKVRYVLENELAGYMTWSINSDSNGTKGGQQPEDSFPLHRAMLEEAASFHIKSRKKSLQHDVPNNNSQH